ncbi:hypothetical protein FH581_022705 (plasmid) [Leptospira weilii]|uniref:hypothetical protein n=1 Tax=Leptospira weilii TaxID=28184 RepID=UPI00201B79FA|nr:hypothetical protein [Leptospira weilii]UPY81067.1 hypothetical protein FH581_022705 [Leptospira weilii]
MTYICLVCGFNELEEQPYVNNSGSYEICPCCGFQFGVSDDDAGFTHDNWRQKWIFEGMKWWSRGSHSPPNWDPKEQLKRIGIFL